MRSNNAETNSVSVNQMFLNYGDAWKRPFGRPKRRWENSIRMDLHEVGWGTWTGLLCLRKGNGGGLL